MLLGLLVTAACSGLHTASARRVDAIELRQPFSSSGCCFCYRCYGGQLKTQCVAVLEHVANTNSRLSVLEFSKLFMGVQHVAVLGLLTPGTS
jgi:hypothetical protein